MRGGNRSIDGIILFHCRQGYFDLDFCQITSNDKIWQQYFLPFPQNVFAMHHAENFRCQLKTCLENLNWMLETRNIHTKVRFHSKMNDGERIQCIHSFWTCHPKHRPRSVLFSPNNTTVTSRHRINYEAAPFSNYFWQRRSHKNWKILCGNGIIS